MVEHFEHRHDRSQQRLATVLTCAFLIMNMQDTLTTKRRPRGDALPILRIKPKAHIDIARVVFAEMIRHRRPVHRRR